MSINSADLQEREMEGKTLPAPLGSSMKSIPGAKGFSWKPKFVYMGLMAALATLAYITIYTLPFAVIARAPSHLSTFKRRSGPREPPEYAQRIYPKEFAVLDTVPPPTEFDGSSLFVPPGTTKESLKAKPFHIYDDSFLDIIGTNPTLTLIADSGTNPLFHEAVVWYTVKDEVLFTQNAGAKAAGTGLNKSAVIEKILLSEAAAVQKHERNQTEVFVVNSTVQVMNPNGATPYGDKFIFAGQGQGPNVPPALYMLDPEEPYHTTIILNNFFGRQFNSLNDVSVNPRNGEIYFTDVMYAYLQDFRPAPGLPNQVYRFNLETGLVQVVADGINMPNGITFSPDGRHAYVSDTAIFSAFWGTNYTYPATIYRWDVEDDGTWSNRKLFAYIHVGAADGIHTDSHGNLYAGVGDGIHVFNPSGMLIGKIYLGETSANFNFAGHGRMVICAETHLYYATLGVSGWVPKAKTV
ncbi:gluconolactonase [Cryptococcus deuterogattii R265]|uniref:gluconolactonase n=1 Tax=Cryptococcus deuterogattii (strain R265) TaxID=294750 RepID=UPI001937D418|nr:gluconolactonase [Cryptococcus deuterogattii R265]